MPVFPKEFVDIARTVFGERADLVLEALESGESVTAVRANGAKISAETLRSRFAGAEPVPWRTDAFYLAERPAFSLDPLLHAGAYYVQDPAAMFVGSVADALIASEERPLRVLDLCAAPGGKSTCLAAALKCDDLLVANEVIGSRATILAENLVKWGAPNAIVTNNDPKDFGRLGANFDIVLADVPCSGEGMFRKDAGALAQWSPENVNLCASRQRRIIADVWDSLVEGGWLIYSTCTFNRCENDDNVEWICRELGAEVVHITDALSSGGLLHTEELRPISLAASLPSMILGSAQSRRSGFAIAPADPAQPSLSPDGECYPLRDNYQLAGPSRYITPRVETSSVSNLPPAEGAIATKYGLQFAPGITRGEGQYVALVRKTASAKATSAESGRPVASAQANSSRSNASTPAKSGKQDRNAKPAKSVKCDWVMPGMACYEVETSAGKIRKAYPANLECAIRGIESSLKVIRSGVAVAAVKGHDLVPQADLALSQAFNREALPQIELTRDQALEFLRCEALQLPEAPKGFIAVTYEHLPLGFVKNLGNRANNLFPQAWRLRM